MRRMLLRLCEEHVTDGFCLGRVREFTTKQRALRWSSTKSLALHKPHCWLTNKRNIPTAINRASRIPTASEITQCRLGLTSFDLAPFCAAPRPNQKRRLPMAVSAVTGAALWWPYHAYDYGEPPHSASAKSPNLDRGYPE